MDTDIVTSSPNALVVDPRSADAQFITQALSGAGFSVMVLSFGDAKALLNSNPPALLVADVCQGEFNGLHLVIRGRAVRPSLAALVTCPYDDPVLRREAESFGAVFIVKPTTAEEIAAAAARALRRGADDKQPIRPPFERRRVERRRTALAFVGHERRQADRRRALAASYS